MARTKYKITKLSGTGGLISLTDREKVDLYRWLEDVVASSKRERESDRWNKLTDLVSTEVYESIVSGLEDEITDIKNFHAFSFFTTDNPHIYEIDIILKQANLVHAKDAFKTLLRTSSALDGVRGRSENGKVRYTLAVDVGAGHGYIADGVHRLVRLVYGFYKFKSGEDL